MTSHKKIGIGIDVGGTYTKIVAADPAGRLLRTIQVETRPKSGPEAFVDRVTKAVGDMRSGPIRAVGLGLAGDVDSEQGLLRFAPNLQSFVDFGFKDAFRSGLKVPVSVDNDANMAAWGGYVIELGRKPSHAVCMTLGTGIGGGLIIDGRLHHGATGTAGEIGHLCVEPGGDLCNCGMRGCLEAYAGSYGILRTVKKLLKTPKGRKSLLWKLCPDLNRLDTRCVALAAKKGDAVSVQAWAKTGRCLGIGICDIVYLLNPDAVLLVGGVSAAGALLLAPIRKILRAQPFRRPFGRVSVSIGSTPNLGALGAALWGLESAEAD